MGLYCSRLHAGYARRKGKTATQKREEKRLYDIEYRRKNRALLKAKKAAYFQRTYDPVRAAEDRKKRMPRHVEYCRQPEYKAWKRDYDRRYRANKDFGPFAEAHLALKDLENEIDSRMSWYERKLANGNLNKRQQRKREYVQAF